MVTAPADSEAQRLDALMGRAQAGDRSAAQAAFALLWPPTVAYAAALERRHGESGRAEDIAQEALVKVFQRLSDFDGALLAPAALRKRRQRVLDRLRRAFRELTG